MAVNEDVPWHLLHCHRNNELIAATVPAAVSALAYLALYAHSNSDTSSVVGCIATYLVLQVSLGWWALMHGPSQKDLQRIAAWIRAHGPELHRRIAADFRHAGDVIGSPYMVTYYKQPVASDLTERHLDWALQSEYYSSKELKIIRLLRTYLDRFGHQVGVERVITQTQVVDLPFFALSEQDIAGCSL